MSDTEPTRRHQAVDLALAMVTLVVVGTAITANVGAGEVNPTAYLFGALFGGLMLVRRRWPVGTLLVSGVALLGYYMLDYPPIGLALPVAAALFSAAERGRTVWAVGTALALLGISTAVRVGQGDNLGFVLGLELPTSAGLMAAMIALGDSVRARRGWRAESAARARAVAAEHELELAGRLEQERLRVARDLHDLLAHTVSVIALHTDVARESLRDDPATAERSLATARTACRDAGRELRATVDALRASGAADPPAPNLHRLAELVAPAEAAGRTVTIERSPATTELPAIVDLTAYRVIQESLSNILRHSDARTVHVEIDRDDTDLVVRVTDDGTAPPGPADPTRTTDHRTAYPMRPGDPGPASREPARPTRIDNDSAASSGSAPRARTTGHDTASPDPTGKARATEHHTSPHPGAGWGIIGMRERVTLLGGTVDAGHRRAGGFRVEARIPLRGKR